MSVESSISMTPLPRATHDVRGNLDPVAQFPQVPDIDEERQRARHADGKDPDVEHELVHGIERQRSREPEAVRRAEY